MKSVMAIALNTFREVVRNRIFIVLLLMAGALTCVVLAMGSASLNQEIRIVVDVGFFLISTITVMLSILLGGTMVHKELERKTVYTILSKPIHRYEFILGKYLGNILTSALMVALLGALLAICLALVGGEVTPTFGVGVWFVFIEVMIISAVSIFFISFSSPILSGALSIGVFVMGRFVPTLLAFRFKDQDSGMETVEHLIHGMARIAPDLSLYNVTPNLIHDAPVSLNFVWQATGAGLAYVCICLFIASMIFSRRDLT